MGQAVREPPNGDRQACGGEGGSQGTGGSSSLQHGSKRWVSELRLVVSLTKAESRPCRGCVLWGAPPWREGAWGASVRERKPQLERRRA